MARALTRREILKALGAGTAALSLPWSLRADEARKPNILFLFTDDQAFRTVNAVNNPDIKTPNIDRLVKQGTTFTHCFHQGSFSGAVCVASRAALNTGRYIWTCGSGNCGTYPLWGETFRKAGYETFMTGKWHNGDATLKRSFEHVGPTAGGMLPSKDPNAKENAKKGIRKDPYHRPEPGNTWLPEDDTLQGHWCKTPDGIQHSSQRWANSAIEFLEKKATGSTRPFFMYVAFHAPHDPRQSPKEYVDMYPPEKIKIPPNFQPKHPFDQGDSKIRDEQLAPFPRTKEAVQLHLSEYYAIISHADYHIGRVLDALEKSGRAKDTLIVFSADHGLAVGEHGLMGKQNLYDHSLRIPLVFSGPGIEKDRKTDSLVYLPSLFATTCDVAGVAAPDSVQFPSIKPLLDGKTDAVHDCVYAAYKDLQRSVRTTQYKLIRYPKAKEVQLYDIQKDPWETKDLAEDPACASIVKELDAKLLEWMKRTEDKLPPESLKW